MQELCNELNLRVKNGVDNSPVSYKPSDLKIIKRGKDNEGTWLHPSLFIDYAMWLSLEDEHEKLQQKIGLIPKKHSRFRIVTIADENRFIGKWLKKKETDEWLCYQVDDGSVLRFRKEHIISISEQII